MELETDHCRQQHGGGLAEHACLGFNASDAPTDHAQAVNHGGVGVGAHHSVGIRGAIFIEHHRSQVFKVHLVNDARVRRHRPEILKRRLSPT